jgi:hypothetical protein
LKVIDLLVPQRAVSDTADEGRPIPAKNGENVPQPIANSGDGVDAAFNRLRSSAFKATAVLPENTSDSTPRLHNACLAKCHRPSVRIGRIIFFATGEQCPKSKEP